MGQKAPKGPAYHPLGIEPFVGRRKPAALSTPVVFIFFSESRELGKASVFLILFSSRKKECPAASKQKNSLWFSYFYAEYNSAAKSFRILNK